MSNSKEIKALAPFVKKITTGGEKYFELLNKECTSKMHSGYVTLKPGEEIGRHSTGSNEEIIIAVEGSGIVEANGIKNNIAAGQIAYNPPETLHNVINNGRTPFCYVFVVSEA